MGKLEQVNCVYTRKSVNMLQNVVMMQFLEHSSYEHGQYQEFFSAYLQNKVINKYLVKQWQRRILILVHTYFLSVTAMLRQFENDTFMKIHSCRPTQPTYQPKMKKQCNFGNSWLIRLNFGMQVILMHPRENNFFIDF